MKSDVGEAITNGAEQKSNVPHEPAESLHVRKGCQRSQGPKLALTVVFVRAQGSVGIAADFQEEVEPLRYTEKSVCAVELKAL